MLWSHDPIFNSSTTTGTCYSSGLNSKPSQCHPFPPNLSSTHATQFHLVDPPSSSSSSPSSSYSLSFFLNRFKTIAASMLILDPFALYGITAVAAPPQSVVEMIGIRLWHLLGFKLGLDLLGDVNLWGRLGFLPILMDFNGTNLFFVSEMKNLWFESCYRLQFYQIVNIDVRIRLEMTLVEKMVVNKLRWSGHVQIKRYRFCNKESR